MNPDATGDSEFLRPLWSRLIGPPWVVTILLFAGLIAMRFYAVFGPPQARPLFLVYALLMWIMPAVILSVQGRREIGLCLPSRTLKTLALSTLAGLLIGLLFFAVGLASIHSPDSLLVSIRDGVQLAQLRATMPLAAVFAVIVVPAMIFTPVGEEILFRGILQESFARRWGVAVATLANGLGFGLVHLHLNAIVLDAAGFHLHPAAAATTLLSLLAASAIFTFIRLRFGSLYPAIAAHSACNLAMISSVILYYAH